MYVINPSDAPLLARLAMTTVEWYIQTHGAFNRMEPWEKKYFEDAIAEGLTGVTYVWRCPKKSSSDEIEYRHYEVDFVEMQQINTQTQTKRRLLRLTDRDAHKMFSPYANDAHKMFSPYAINRLGA